MVSYSGGAVLPATQTRVLLLFYLFIYCFYSFYCVSFIDCVSVYEGTEEHHGIICARTITCTECLGATEDVSNFSTLGGWATTQLLQRDIVVSPLHGNLRPAPGI